MPSRPEKDRCAAMDKQVRYPDLVWDCPMGLYGEKKGAVALGSR